MRESRREQLTEIFGDRYEILEMLGRGGAGEVWRIRDPDLTRTSVVKVLRPDRLDPTTTYRFMAESQLMAQLDHPTVVPIYELGELPDGSPYFTMREVRGQTLRQVLQVTSVPRDTLALRRLLEVLHRLCEGVAYAHSRGVVHRDLKPENVMVGQFGETLILDWGLAKVISESTLERDPAIWTFRDDFDLYQTTAGEIMGTPMYMSPEQAAGRDAVGPPADVYALGALLYEILSGHSPHRGRTLEEILHEVQEEAMPSLTPEVPEALAEICTRALAKRPEDRYKNAGMLARSIRDWLDGARKREQALWIVQQADTLGPEITRHRRQALSLQRGAEELLRDLPSHAPITLKVPAWERQDQAKALRQRARIGEVKYTQMLRAALMEAPDLPEAHERLATLHLTRHQAAESEQDEEEAMAQEALLRVHDRGQHAAYLRGDGALTLYTDPPGAAVDLFMVEAKERRLTPRFVRSLGVTPLHELSLPRGSYVLRIRLAGHDEVRYPVFIKRMAHWDGVPPQGTEPEPIHLPLAGSLSPEECYVPAGWCLVGGPDDHNGLPRMRIWIPSYVMNRFPVTNQEYLAFLNDLVAQGREEEALELAPRELEGVGDHRGSLLYGRRSDGRFELVPDAQGDTWHPQWPVLSVHWFGAMAFADWRSEVTGLPYRLALELEREKAARGVDGRVYPWGSFMDPTWAAVKPAFAGRALPCRVRSFPVDESVYGVRGLAGNSRDWCLDEFVREGIWRDGQALCVATEAARQGDERLRVVRGGAWNASIVYSRAGFRFGPPPQYRNALVGFRLVRSMPSGSPVDTD